MISSPRCSTRGSGSIFGSPVIRVLLTLCLVLGTPACDALFPSDHWLQDGRFYVSDAPGLGVDFDEEEAQRYDYTPGSHPIVRLEDGTLWNY